ncbi:uncharacterized protein LOC113502127 [Trichoplusia ni]|uniref:Uncharacterized protein LOC113502127 n=1 Tax=Trichoplusia ni TaxID=7111 RepID=A0A7E5WF30_TRINI|nr:uncharacterized protein LOC113502127 [Trichoplusia ni]
MDEDPSRSLQTKRSYLVQGRPDNYCKSDINVVGQNECNLSTNASRKRDVHAHQSARSLGEYYKKYEHDEVPVKDSNYQDLTTAGDRGSLTNSDLDKLEMKIFKNMSQELQTDDYSNSSLDSNIKFFRTTVQEIFDNFYASMRDFELYKKRFHEILAKNKEEAVADMEDFIKDMIQHIMSSETSLSNESRKSNDNASMTHNDKETNISIRDDASSVATKTCSGTDNINSVVEAYKNDNYLTDSTLEDHSSKNKRPATKEEIFNIYLLSGNPCVQIKMNDRNLLSEINIKEPGIHESFSKHVASAENIERLTAKKKELEKYVQQQLDTCLPERDIPVKVSYAKKNIYLNEDFTHDRETEKSFISKICNFLCKKFRKTS